MKKVLSIALVAGLFSIIACGPSQQEKDAKAEKVKQDSIDAVMAQDSMAAAASAMMDTANHMEADTASKMEAQ